MTDGPDAARAGQPSWEQLLHGARPTCGLTGTRPGRSPRHGRDAAHHDDERPDHDLVEFRFAAIVEGLRLGTGELLDERVDGMGWTDAAAWTAVAAGGTLLLASCLGEILR